MVYIFVARDPDYKDSKAVSEFERYTKGLENLEYTSGSIMEKPEDRKEQHVEEACENLDDIAAAALLGNGEAAFTLPYLRITVGDDHIFVIDMHASRLKARIRKIIEDGAEVSIGAAQDVESFLKLFVGLAKVTLASSVQLSDIHLFVHWGGGAPLELEKTFRSIVDKSSQYKGIKTFAVSTRLLDRFDVTQPVIELPQDGEALRNLVLRCMFDSVKDTMTCYVANCQIGKKSMDVSTDDLDRLKEYLVYANKAEIKLAGKKRVNSRHRMLSLKLNESVMSQFAVLLREEMCHG